MAEENRHHTAYGLKVPESWRSLCLLWIWQGLFLFVFMNGLQGELNDKFSEAGGVSGAIKTSGDSLRRFVPDRPSLHKGLSGFFNLHGASPPSLCWGLKAPRPGSKIIRKTEANLFVSCNTPQR